MVSTTTLETLPSMDVAGQDPPAARAVRGRGHRRPARHPPAERAVPDRLHRLGRDGARHRDRRAARDRRPVQGPVGRADRRVRRPARVGVGTTQTRQSEILREAATGIGRLGLEAHGVSWAQQRAFGDWFPDAELVATEHLVEDFRMVKDPGEVARVRAACAIADDALADVLPMLHDAPTSATSRSGWSSRCASAAPVA